LYGRGALFDVEPTGLVPRLVGLRPYEHFAVKPEHADEIPVLVPTGGRGLGKSAVLAEVWEAYTQRRRPGSSPSHNLSVRCTALAHPDAWAKDTTNPGGSAADARALTGLLARSAREPVGPIGNTALEDGQLIIAYDDLRLAIHGIREATPDGRTAPPLADVGSSGRR
jgi:hypothetical protein